MLIVKFWHIVETNNVQILDINYDIKNHYTDEQLEELSEHWTKLYDEFYEHRSDKSGKYSMDKNFELTKLSLMLTLLSEIENRLIVLSELVNQKELNSFVTVRLHACIKDFKALYPRVRISILSDVFEAANIVQQVIKSQSNIFDEKVGAIDKNIKKQKDTIYSIVSQLAKILGFSLDINNMTCMEYIGHENTVRESSKKENQLKK